MDETKGIRPLKPGEFRQNKDGTRSTELTRTVTHPLINGGKPTNIPSLYVENGKVVQFSTDDKAVDAAMRTGLSFPMFPDIPTAVEAAKFRSDKGGNASGSLGRKK